MKNAIAASRAFAISLVLVSNVWIADAKAQTFTQPLSLQDLAVNLTSPESIARYMWRHFAFEDDQRQFGEKEYWQTPEELLLNEKGDCEDFALFAQTMLKAAGIPAFVLNVYGDGYAHTVCVFKENGVYHVLDGSDLKRMNAKNIEEVSEKLHPYWAESAIVMRNDETQKGRILKLIDRLQTEQRLSTYA